MNNWESIIKDYGHYLKLERSLAKNSVLAYTQDVEKLAQFMEMHYPTIGPTKVLDTHLIDFIEFLNELGLAAYSQSRIISGLKSFYKYLLYEELLAHDPSELLEGPKLGRKLPDVLNHNEVEALLAAIDMSTMEGTRNRAMLEVLYSSGLRVSELVNLKLSNLMFDIGFLRVLGKGSKERLVPIGGDAMKHTNIYVNEYRNKMANIKAGHENFVFLNRRGAQLTRVMVFTIVKNLAAAASIHKKVSPHTFRHSFATVLVQNGADLRVVQEMLGHESITTTEIYTHIDRRQLTEAIENFHPKGKRRMGSHSS